MLPIYIARWKKILAAIAILIAVAALTTGVVIVATDTEELRTPSPRGAVVTNGHACAEIGKSMLVKNGSAVDAAIAALFCEGVSMPQSMGLGGGFFMTIYDRESGTAETMDAREVAPGAATEDMYHGDENLSRRGGMAVAVPGELRGYWQAHQKYGKLPWKDLVQPTINLCRNGILMTEFLARTFLKRVVLLRKDPMLREVFIDPNTDSTYKEGQHFLMLKYAKTLETIAEEGGDALNDGSLTKAFVEDVQNMGGIITEEDMNNFQPKWDRPIATTLPKNQTLLATPLPGSGIILSFILNIVSDRLDFSKPTWIPNWQRIVESFKFGYGRRTELGDADYVDIGELIANLTSKSYANSILIRDNFTSQNASYYGATTTQVPDHGTAHICVLAPNGDAVAVTSTINYIFGAEFASQSTGIVLNDEMDDFSSPNITNQFDIPPSPANYIVPGKRPLSSMCPSIVIDKNTNSVRLLTGGAGGTKITTAIALLIIRHLLFGHDLASAMAENRIHHQLFPMELEFELSYNDTAEGRKLISDLAEIGHKVAFSPVDGFSAITSISRSLDGKIVAVSDKRRPGSEAYIY